MAKVDMRRVKQISAQARAAKDDGSKFFTPVLNLDLRWWQRASGRVVDWEPMLEAVVAEGWRLEQWAVAASHGHAVAMPLFVRSHAKA